MNVSGLGDPRVPTHQPRHPRPYEKNLPCCNVDPLSNPCNGTLWACGCQLSCRIAITWGNATSARSASSCSLTRPIGCRISAKGKPAMPKVCAVMRAELANCSVQITAAGLPRCSIINPSYTLYEEHDPQSPIPTSATSFSAATWSSSAVGAGRYAPGLR